jgi:hypothetical protein
VPVTLYRIAVIFTGGCYSLTVAVICYLCLLIFTGDCYC